MRLDFWRRQPERVIFLDEDAFAVVGNGQADVPPRSSWPADGVYGPIPAGGAIGRVREVLDHIGPELWQAKRRGGEARLIRQLPTYDTATALLWGADCVEHFARRAQAVDGNVVETIALARSYATRREYDSRAAQRLASESETIMQRLRKDGVSSFGLGVVSRAAELQVDVLGLLNPSETEYEADEFSLASLRAMQVALMHATRELCRADPLAAAREAARWCRRASARRALAQESGDRANKAHDSSFLNLWLNPFASGTLSRSLLGQSRAIQDGDEPEAEWQAARLTEYLQRTDNTPLPPPEPW
jgi:hypothetical protein